MSYLALYRKYRPTNLNEIVGQSEIKQILKLSVENNTFSHAYLFFGPRGTGKTTTAKIFAKMINCENLVDGVPCGVCNACKNLFVNNDVVEIDAASNNGVDEIRELREKVNLVPSICRYKVYIIDEVHMLTTQAFNALLKTLEEPPKHVIFILATTEYHKVPSTIVSRCQKFQFNKISIDDNIAKLKEISKNEDINIDDDALYEIAKLSDGGLRDSINYLDQLRSYSSTNINVSNVFEVCGGISLNDMSNFLLYLHENKINEVINFLESISVSGKSYSKFLEDLLVIIRDVVLVKNECVDSLVNDKKIICSLSDVYDFEELFKLIDTINGLFDKIRFANKSSIVVVSCFLSFMNSICDFSYTENKQSFDNKSVKNGNDTTCNLASDVVNKHKDKIKKVLINRDIIVNNCFCVANKDYKVNLQKKWNSISDYFTNDDYKLASSILADSVIEVAGEGYILLVGKYDSIIDKINYYYDECELFINYLFDGHYKFVIVSNDEWNRLKSEYIKNIKNGKKYTLINLKDVSDNYLKSDELGENDSKNNTVVDKLLDLVGSDIVEIK